jgi:hypothetical protein
MSNLRPDSSVLRYLISNNEALRDDEERLHTLVDDLVEHLHAVDRAWERLEDAISVAVSNAGAS